MEVVEQNLTVHRHLNLRWLTMLVDWPITTVRDPYVIGNPALFGTMAKYYHDCVPIVWPRRGLR